MTMATEMTVAELAIAFGVTFVVIYPRADADYRSFFGGDLSRPFRQSLLGLNILKMTSFLFLPDLRVMQYKESQPVTFLFYTLLGIESFCVFFLNLLVPYLLQTRLRGRINIRPGQSLLPWLFSALALQVIGVIGSSILSPHWWAVKRIGDSLSFFPITRTLDLYSRIVIEQPQHQEHQTPIRRKDTTIQTLMALEYMVVVVTWLSALSYGTRQQDETDLLAGFRLAGWFSSSIRLLFHGFMLNMVDESMLPHVQQTTNAYGDDERSLTQHAPLTERL